MIDVDKWLGKQIRTGDGRIWRITRFTGGRGGNTVTLSLNDEDDATQPTPSPVNRIAFPVYLFCGALEYGLIEEV